MTMRLDVTVVIPSYNSRGTVHRAINSVLSQTKLPQELIVVDDFSDDKTLESLEVSFDNNFPIKTSIIRNKSNLGPGLSRNVGWNKARSSWIAFLDADDAWHPQKLELQFQVIEKMPDIDLICSESILFSIEMETARFSFDGSLTNLYFNSLLFKNSIPTRSVVLKSRIPFRFPKGLSEDYALWLQCLDAGLKAVKIKAPLSFHFRPEYSAGGLSANLLMHEKYEFRAILKYYRKDPLRISLALILSILKFCRRLFIIVFRKVFH